jgi:hypothetical protein
VAWWCNKTFGRQTDMQKHMLMLSILECKCSHLFLYSNLFLIEHLSSYWKCKYTCCEEKSSQKGNLETHVKNAQYVYSFHIMLGSGHLLLVFTISTRRLSSVCSCGLAFTDPSTMCRHRIATGHERNKSARRPPSGAILNRRLEDAQDVPLYTIEDTSYTPKPFDTTYHHSRTGSGSFSSSLSQPLQSTSPFAPFSGSSSKEDTSRALANPSNPITPAFAFSDIAVAILPSHPHLDSQYNHMGDLSELNWYAGNTREYRKSDISESSLHDIPILTSLFSASSLESSAEAIPFQSKEKDNFGYNYWRENQVPFSTTNDWMSLDPSFASQDDIRSENGGVGFAQSLFEVYASFTSAIPIAVTTIDL